MISRLFRPAEGTARSAGSHLVLFVWLSSFAVVGQAQLPTVQWDLPAEEARIEAPEGHAWIRWEPLAGVDGFLVEQTPPDDEVSERFVTDSATFLSGLSEGTTRLRVRAVRDEVPGPWSEPLIIEVTYPELGWVAILAALGSLLFVATVVLVVVGHRQTRGRLPVEAPAENGR